MPGLSPAAVQNLLDSYRTLGARTASQNDPIARAIGSVGGDVSDAIYKDRERSQRLEDIESQRAWQADQQASQRAWVEQQRQAERAQELKDREANYMASMSASNPAFEMPTAAGFVPPDSATSRFAAGQMAQQRDAMAGQQAMAGLVAPVEQPPVSIMGGEIPLPGRSPTQSDILQRFTQMTTSGQTVDPSLIPKAMQAVQPPWTPERAAEIAAAQRPPPKPPTTIPGEIASPFLRAFGIEPSANRQYTKNDLSVLGKLPPPKAVDPTDAALKDARLAKINAEVKALQMGGRLTQAQQARIDIARREHMAALRDDDQSRATEAIEAMKRVVGESADETDSGDPAATPEQNQKLRDAGFRWDGGRWVR